MGRKARFSGAPGDLGPRLWEGVATMAGPTDILTEDVKDLRESHRQLAGEVHELRSDLAGFRTEVAEGLGKVRAEVAEGFGKVRAEMGEKLGTINETLVRLEARLDHSISVAKWTIAIL